MRGICIVIPYFVHGYWFLAASAATIALVDIPGLQVFRSLVLLAASRGKTWEGRPKPMQGAFDISVHQSFFSHFYAIGTASTFLTTYALLANSRHLDQVGAEVVMLLALFQFHVVRRLLESIWLLKYPKNARMHILAYLFGLSYYIVVPLSMIRWSEWEEVCSSNDKWTFDFDTVLKNIGKWQAGYTPSIYSIAGSTMFLASSLLQLHSHYILSRLRNQKEKSNQHGYQIPQGGLFSLVSCPHYFAEIGLYLGLAILSSCTLPMCLLLSWVVVNLVLGGVQSHKWYHKRFEDYPKSRRAIIPFIL